MEILNFVKHNIGTITTLLAGVGAWGYERNKRKLDIKKYETSNNKSIMDLYQEALDDLKKRYDEKFIELEDEIKLLRTNLETEKKKYTTLKKSFENYRNTNK
tara:strand:+ start:114 stop:419 length:306 start_codon:yes stop_codon:yes gene_type:complete